MAQTTGKKKHLDFTINTFIQPCDIQILTNWLDTHITHRPNQLFSIHKQRPRHAFANVNYILSLCCHVCDEIKVQEKEKEGTNKNAEAHT